MNQLFGTQNSQEDLQEAALRKNRNGASRNMSAPAITPILPNTGGMMETTAMVGGDTLDDIIAQNNKEMQRRRSLQRDRRSSAMEFGSSSNSLGGYLFPAALPGDINLRRQSTGQLEVAGYQNIVSGMDVQDIQMGFTAPMQTEPVAMDASAFASLPTEMSQAIIGFDSGGMEGLVEDSASMNIFHPTTFSNPFNTNMASMANDFMIPETAEDTLPRHRGSIQSSDVNSMVPGIPDLRISDNNMISSPTDMRMGQNSASFGSTVSSVDANMPILPAREPSYRTPAPTASTSAQQMEAVAKIDAEPRLDNPYSKSGFDMIAALTKVAMRKNPEINIGKVDLSCAFVVCNVLLDDCPIVYVSDVFERMTGYNKFEILGRNCRFLQSPNGRVEAGAHREFVDNSSIFYLSTQIAARREAQRAIINYRKGGHPFTNLLTMIPITGEDDKTIKYYVGFQVDLVEKPTSVEGKDINGMYAVDYTQGELPQYRWQPPQAMHTFWNDDLLMGRDEVSSVLTALGRNPASDATREKLNRVLLENTDDVIHVLSLKGLFLYLSPSCQQVLEYDASELIGTALSSVCHPSDIVSVTRELKDTRAGVPISVVFRIRRKKSGYTWFESYGSLKAEQGKGRKFIILVGRERPVYALSRRDIVVDGGISENEIWSKLSTSAMFLFVSSNVQALLDRSPDELIGTSLQDLMKEESKTHFSRALERARAGERITCKHEVLNKRGMILHAQTKLYPGDASSERKPTFIVAQTRLLKNTSRPVAAMAASQILSNQMELSPAEDGVSLGYTTPIIQDGRPNLGSTVSTSDLVTQTRRIEPLTTVHDPDPSPDDDFFEELKTTHCTSWQFELRQMERNNRLLSEELASLLSNRKKRKRRKGASNPQRDCANCHTRVTPEWRRGPSGQRDLCNSCGLRWAKQVSKSGSEQNTHRIAAKGQVQAQGQAESSASRS